MKKVFSIGVALSALISPVYAGTMGPVETGYQWNGIYAGGNIGGKWADYSAPVTISSQLVSGVIRGPFTQNYSTSPSSFTGGGQVGYNLQFNNWVVGAEGNINGEDLNASHVLIASEIPAGSFFVPGDIFTAKSDIQASILGRLGFVVHNNWLLYATGGVGFTNVKFAANFVAVGNRPAAFGSQNHRLVGGTYGGGIEYALSENWRVGVEGRYTDYGSRIFPLGSLATVPAGRTAFRYSSAAADLKMTTGEVLFKINYQLA